MPADAIVKAYQDLMTAIHGIPNSRGAAHMEALQKLENALTPPPHRPVVPDSPHLPPRVVNDAIEYPRVKSIKAPPTAERSPHQLIVTSQPIPTITVDPVPAVKTDPVDSIASPVKPGIRIRSQ